MATGDEASRGADPYSRVDYRRMVRWPERIEREWPFLRRALGNGGRVLDLGCGTGEHSRFLAAQGFEVLGIDASPSMLAKAVETPVPDTLRFVEGDIAEVGTLADGEFDAAICLGNTLPHLQDKRTLLRFTTGLRRRLREGAALVLQVLNYHRIFEQGQRFLPLNFRPGGEPGEEVVFVRLMTLHEDGSLVFVPSTLRLRPDADPPLEVVSSRAVPLRGWRRHEIEDALESAGFDHLDLFGTVAEVPYLPLESPDLVIVAR
ncbi:MAG: Methyltransferase protein [Acidobacteria bacterium]|nr:Methyltransferase protein [Acidobacteriota bacterium]